jgi:hypothetical protein
LIGRLRPLNYIEDTTSGKEGFGLMAAVRELELGGRESDRSWLNAP